MRAAAVRHASARHRLRGGIIHGRARTANVGAVIPTVRPGFLDGLGVVPYRGAMSVQPIDPQQGHDVIHVGAAEAVVIPMNDYLRLRAIERHASADEIEEAEIEAASQAHERWVAAGRPGAQSHDDVMNELLAPSGGWNPPSRG